MRPLVGRDPCFYFVGLDKNAVAGIDRIRTPAVDPLVPGIDEQTIPARVFDIELTIDEADDGVSSRHIRVSKHPVVVRETADRSALGAENLPAHSPQRTCLGADDFKRENHHLRLCEGSVTYAGRRRAHYGRSRGYCGTATGAESSP